MSFSYFSLFYTLATVNMNKVWWIKFTATCEHFYSFCVSLHDFSDVFHGWLLMTHGGWSKLRSSTKEKPFVNRRTECSVRQVAVSCCYRIIWLTEFPFIMPTVLYFALACDHMHKLFSYVFCRDWTQKPVVSRKICRTLRGVNESAVGRKKVVESCWTFYESL